MPELQSRDISVLIDMAGCPNRCRHCWLGCPPNKNLSEETLYWIVQQFQTLANPISVMTWYREPDFAPNYRQLYEIEKELSGGKATRFELLSIWRLARDESYAKWAYDIGTQACQITFFGMEKTTDYFTRRQGAFRDNIIATERLLEVGIKPRWQLFLTKSIISELNDLIDLVNSMNLETRVKNIGGEFRIFINKPSPDGEAWNIEYLRPDVDVISQIPEYLIEKTKAHFGKSSTEEAFGYAEGELIPKFLENSQPYASQPEHLAFMITSGLDVFSNIGDLTPWWKLGNLKTDSINDIIQRFENDENPGLHTYFHIPVSEMAKLYGRKDSRKIYHPGDLKVRLIRQWIQDQHLMSEYIS